MNDDSVLVHWLLGGQLCGDAVGSDEVIEHSSTSVQKKPSLIVVNAPPARLKARTRHR